MKTLLLTTLLTLSWASFSSENISMRTIEKKFETKILTNSEGMTLYTFDIDSLGQSNCDEGCLRIWPAHLTDDPSNVEAPFSTIAHSAGEFHILLDGQPLYTFFGDKNPGDIKGDNLNGVWHIIPLVKK